MVSQQRRVNQRGEQRIRRALESIQKEVTPNSIIEFSSIFIKDLRSNAKVTDPSSGRTVPGEYPFIGQGNMTRNSSDIIFTGSSDNAKIFFNWNNGVQPATFRFNIISDPAERERIANEARSPSGALLFPEGSERRRKLMTEGKIFVTGDSVAEHVVVREGFTGTRFIERTTKKSIKPFKRIILNNILKAWRKLGGMN